MRLVQLYQKVYYPKLHRLCKQFNKFFLLLVWEQLVDRCQQLLDTCVNMLFLASSPILAFGLAMMGLPFFLASWTKNTYTIVHRCNLLPLMLRNCIISPKSSCFKCWLWENGGNAPASSSLLVPIMV
jgi:hypothetical protein